MAAKPGVLIAVRMESHRLPGKALREVQGRPVLAHLIERLQRARRPRAIVVCTTERSDDDAIVDLARRCNVACVRGDDTDVLARYLKAARQHGLDLIVTADGDDPLCDPEIVDAIIAYQEQTGADFVSCDGLPYGTFPYAMTYDALARVCATKAEFNTEGWGRFFTNGEFAAAQLTITDPALRHPEYRLTLDYPEDFALLEAIFDQLSTMNHQFTLRDVFRLLDDRADLVSINAHLREVYEQHFQQYRATS